MKKLYLIFVLLFVVFLFGCKESGDINSTETTITISPTTLNDNSLLQKVETTTSDNNIDSDTTEENITTSTATSSTANSTKVSSATTTKKTTTTTKPPVGRTWKYEEEMTNELFKLVNDYRMSQGENTMAYDKDCAKRAKTRAEYNAKNGIFADHDVGQIGTGGYINGGAQAMLKNWINSLGHRKSMIDSIYTKGGCAIYSDSRGVYYAILDHEMDGDWS